MRTTTRTIAAAIAAATLTVTALAVPAQAARDTSWGYAQPNAPK